VQPSYVKVRTGEREAYQQLRPREQPSVQVGVCVRTRHTLYCVQGGLVRYSSGGFSEAGSRTLYWELGAEMTGDKLTSYGGVFKITLRYDGSGSPPDSPMIIIRGNDITLIHMYKERIEPNRDIVITLRMYETEWMREDRQPVLRPHLLMTLAHLDTVLVRATHASSMRSSDLLDAQIDYAVDADTRQERAQAVEQCRCPVGYKGLSCEECADGYKRTGGGLYLGTCEPCQCNGHATTCDPETGACIDCKHHTTGENCETCEPGYTGDARRGTPQDCQLMTSNVPCDCHNHSPRGCDSVGRCLECEHFTEGYHCERCKPGHYGDATRGTPYDCTKCPCPGASECYLDPATNEVVCKTCPPGYTGNRCQE
jgi:dystroglycan 1